MITNEYEVFLEDNIMWAPKYKDTSPRGGLGRFIIESCDKYSEKVYQSCPYTNKSLTFNDFKQQSVTLATNLGQQYAIKQGDIIMTCMKNSLENGLPVAATFLLGGIFCSLDPTLSTRDCEHMISVVKPKLIILDEECAEMIRNALQAMNQTEIDLILNRNSKHHEDGCVYLEDLLLNTEHAKDFNVADIVDENSPAVILFSSGTTGLPKGICLSHKSIYFGGMTFYNVTNNRENCLHYTTFYWISGILIFIGAFLHGVKRIGLRQFSIQEFCDIVESSFLATSYLMKFLEAKKHKNSLRTLKDVAMGGVMASREQFMEILKTFPNIAFTQAYGMTECNGATNAFMANYRELFPAFPDSSGPPLPGFSVKVVDVETRERLPPHHKGEICMKSEYNMLGYYNNNTENPVDAEGFIKSGDIGYYDERKLIYISGRIKDMFKYQSWHIVPASIEAIIREHPSIEEVVVFGIPHVEDGHLPAAAVMFKQAYANHTVGEVEKFVEERVADRQRLRGGVFVVEDMPRTPTGKVQRNKVADIVLKSLE